MSITFHYSINDHQIHAVKIVFMKVQHRRGLSELVFEFSYFKSLNYVLSRFDVFTNQLLWCLIQFLYARGLDLFCGAKFSVETRDNVPKITDYAPIKDIEGI